MALQPTGNIGIGRDTSLGAPAANLPKQMPGGLQPEAQAILADHGYPEVSTHAELGELYQNLQGKDPIAFQSLLQALTPSVDLWGDKTYHR